MHRSTLHRRCTLALIVHLDFAVSFMMTSLQDFWLTELAKHDASMPEPSRVAFACLLTKNKFTSLRSLRFADAARDWLGADMLEKAVLESFQVLCKCVQFHKITSALPIALAFIIFPRRKMAATEQRGAAGPAQRERSPRRQQKAQIEDLMQARAPNKASEGHGPRAALSRMHLDIRSDAEVAKWAEEASIDAILGSCARSLPSLRSGVRCYIAFAGARATTSLCCGRVATKCPIVRFIEALGEEEIFPARPADIARLVYAVSLRRHVDQLFGLCKNPVRAHQGSNEGSHIGTCYAERTDALWHFSQVFDNIALQRAKSAIAKRHNFAKRSRQWIKRLHTVDRQPARKQHALSIYSAGPCWSASLIGSRHRNGARTTPSCSSSLTFSC